MSSMSGLDVEMLVVKKLQNMTFLGWTLYCIFKPRETLKKENFRSKGKDKTNWYPQSLVPDLHHLSFLGDVSIHSNQGRDLEIERLPFLLWDRRRNDN